MQGVRPSGSQAVKLTLEAAGRRWTADDTRWYDLSIPLAFDAAQPSKQPDAET